MNGESPPKIYITEPLGSLQSFLPEKLKNGDLRMAIACAGQHAYNMWGEQATLTEEFLSRDYKTWEGGLVSINHEQNQPWVKARMYNLEYDAEKKLVISSFSGIPEWLMSLIYSEDYRGLSQECIPIEMRKNSTDVIKGYGTGCTIVTSPYEPAANQGMGVGIPPALAAILASKYPQKEDSMPNNNGDGKAVISIETYEKDELKSQVKALETDNKKKDEEIASWKQKYTELESGEVDRTKIAISEARKSWEAELRATAEKETAITDLKSVMSEDAAKEYLSTNPTVDQIKSITKVLKVSFSKGVGSNQNNEPKAENKNMSCQFEPDPWTGKLNAEVK